jgi:hypothetical protein
VDRIGVETQPKPPLPLAGEVEVRSASGEGGAWKNEIFFGRTTFI